jgi:hypothetical protein
VCVCVSKVSTCHKPHYPHVPLLSKPIHAVHGLSPPASVIPYFQLHYIRARALSTHTHTHDHTHTHTHLSKHTTLEETEEHSGLTVQLCSSA